MPGKPWANHPYPSSFTSSRAPVAATRPGLSTPSMAPTTRGQGLHQPVAAGARRSAGLVTSGHEDMHAGEIETSILLHAHPELVREGYHAADWAADDRRHLLIAGMGEYTRSGVIGRPSLATAEKGKAVLASLVDSFASVLEILQRG